MFQIFQLILLQLLATSNQSERDLKNCTSLCSNDELRALQHEEETIPSILAMPLQHNLSNKKTNTQFARVRDSIKYKENELSENNNTLEELYEMFHNASHDFVHSLKIESGDLSLTNKYLTNTSNFIESIKQHNLIVLNYKCLTNRDDISEIPEEYDRAQFKKRAFIMGQYRHLYNLISKCTIYVTGKLTMVNLANLHTAVGVYNLIVNSLKRILISKIKIYKPFSNVLVSATTKLKYLEERLEKNTRKLDLLQDKLHSIFQIIIFVIGFIGNSLLLTIFARHKEIQTVPNMLILNLALCDVFNLVINVPIFNWHTISENCTVCGKTCLAFRFCRYLGIAVSVYSILIICLHRLLALTYRPKSKTYCFEMSMRTKTLVSLISVWTMGFFIAIPHLNYGSPVEGKCPELNVLQESFTYYHPFLRFYDFILICVIPLTFITLSSLYIAYKIRNSIRNMPGESVSIENHIKIGLSVQGYGFFDYCLCYQLIPYYLFMLLKEKTNVDITNEEYIIIREITYGLNFANCCFNPIATYISSQKFRKYFSKYLFCRKI
ncbi:hypothetical protein C0J52_28493 [Blattella germanica]|nr:hypothetical protein C0J52_28493 [Blattella germanica]